MRSLLVAAGLVFFLACGFENGITQGSSPATPAESTSSSSSSGSVADASPSTPNEPNDAGGVVAPLTKTLPAPLPVADGFYPRAIQLQGNGTIIASVVRFLGQRMGATFFESTDLGVSFKEIGMLNDPIMNNGGLCCGTLYELPKALGALPAGTLLWSASSGGDAPNQPMRIPVWKSSDQGRTWTFLSMVAVGAVPRREGGLWEPEFMQLDDGTLVCHWSDETESDEHSQKLVEARTSDGITWRDHRDTVAVNPREHRPGMPNIRRLATSGTYVMSYEICGVAGDSCTAWFRTSNDGWNWGDVRQRGIRPTTVEGKHFRHAPTLAWTAKPGNGRLLMVGQMLHHENGAVAPENGRVLLANTEGGLQSWYAIPAPVEVPNAYDNFCPNYSSTLLPLRDGEAVLEIASRWDGTACRSYFARAPLTDTSDTKEVTDGTTARFVSVMSGLCLDVAGGSTAAGGDVIQFTCNGGPAQRWTVKRNLGDVITLRAAVSNMCLTVANNGSAAPGTNVQQEPCGGTTSGQEWKLRAMGLDTYELLQNGTTNCLDVAGGSTAPGGNVAQWTCNDLAPQIWHLQRL